MISFAQVIKGQIAKLPEVVAVVLSDASGALLESIGGVDEVAAAPINAIAVRSLNTIGEQLGIGGLKRASLTGPGFALVLTTNGQEVVGLYVDPAKPLAGLEKRLDGLLYR